MDFDSILAHFLFFSYGCISLFIIYKLIRFQWRNKEFSKQKLLYSIILGVTLCRCIFVYQVYRHGGVRDGAILHITFVKPYLYILDDLPSLFIFMASCVLFSLIFSTWCTATMKPRKYLKKWLNNTFKFNIGLVLVHIAVYVCYVEDVLDCEHWSNADSTIFGFLFLIIAPLLAIFARLTRKELGQVPIDFPIRLKQMQGVSSPAVLCGLAFALRGVLTMCTLFLQIESEKGSFRWSYNAVFYVALEMIPCGVLLRTYRKLPPNLKPTVQTLQLMIPHLESESSLSMGTMSLGDPLLIN
eukprot:TRINITY_DN780107_c0_g1_i1.p1 TRINITY_DN780107_c0_g1~~TRINITY_DN780107_c0_g1_i1.p1  ORF type:complete len:299 (-),score=21.98 TRINITY_DN780107_c0_g1_i1:180-1076(-)